jgi:alpha-L-fucosidase
VEKPERAVDTKCRAQCAYHATNEDWCVTHQSKFPFNQKKCDAALANRTEATKADIVGRLRSLSLNIEGLGYSRAREGWHETVREAADRIEYLEKREAYLVAELNACTNVPNGDKG